MNGEEFLLVHRPELLEEVLQVISKVDAEACKTKISKEKGSLGKKFYSPIELNRIFRLEFKQRDWTERRSTYWVTADESVLRSIVRAPESEQKRAIISAGFTPIMTYNQTDFVKQRAAIEVQFGKYSFVAHDLFVKHLSFYVSDIIDVGIEILPMKSLETEMSSGVAYFERDLMNLVRQGRGVPAVPLVLIGVEP